MNPESWQTLWLSLRISSLATIAALLIALPLAHVNAKSRYWGKSLLEGFIVVPMVLPPTVVGYLIIASLGVQGWVGHYLHKWLSYSILFRFEGAVLAAAVVAMPLLYLPTRAAFAAIDRDMEDVARVMGANRLQLFWYVSLPMALRGLTSGMMLAFARALGEFGATVMVFGIRINHTTLPVSIYINYEQGEMGRAVPAVALLCALSMTMTLLYNRSTLSSQA
jgi:molybdate transport system permease protein